MINLSAMSVAELKNLQTQIAGDLVRRFGGFIDLSREAQPAGGAVFRDRPAIGGDRNTDLWFPTLDAANAYLVRQAGQGHVDVAENGTMSFDYTHPGCSSSYMETRVVPSQEPVAARTCSHCGVVTPRDNAGCYRCGLEEPRGSEPTSTP